MEQAQFERMVARLERESEASPRLYQWKVAALALLGFGVLAVVLGAAGLGLLVLAAIAVATLLTGGKALILLFKLGKLLILLAVPLWMLVKSSLAALFTRLPAPEGVPLRRAQAPALFAVLDDMRRRMKGPRFHHVLLVDDMNAAVVQRPLFGLVGWPRNYLLLGLPLLESLSPDEALAVVAHEYGHLAGSHGHFAAFVYRLRHTWGTIQSTADQWQGWAARPLQRIVRWYAPYFNAYTFVLARANEYQADAASAELVGAGVAASALKRVNIASPHYDHFVQRTFATMRDVAQPPRDLALQWAAHAPQAPLAENATQWLQQALQRRPEVFDTHPVLRERLRALPGQADAADELPGPLAGASAATMWFGASLEALREVAQRRWHERVAAPWAEHHQALQERLRRLGELEARAEPSLDEQLERWRLRLELHPETDHLDALAAFNADHPDQPLALYLEAGLRLDRGDDTGLAALERTIALDADATKPACEKAYAFLKSRQDARADAWAERWRQHDAMEAARAHQLAHPEPTHALQPAALDSAQLERARTVLKLGGEGVKRAWLARRVLPADPTVVTYLLGVELTPWARWRGRRHAVVNKLAEFEWPVHVMICALDGAFKTMAKPLKAVAGSELRRPW